MGSRTKQGLQKNGFPDIPDINQTIVDLDSEDQSSEQLRRRLLLRRFWESAAYFWRGEGQRASWLLTAGILLTIVLNLAVSYGMNLWNRAIFDSLEKHETRSVVFLSFVLLPLAGVERLLHGGAGLRAHDHAAALAPLVDSPSARSLA
jgi:hypothetical protein